MSLKVKVTREAAVFCGGGGGKAEKNLMAFFPFLLIFLLFNLSLCDVIMYYQVVAKDAVYVKRRRGEIHPPLCACCLSKVVFYDFALLNHRVFPIFFYVLRGSGGSAHGADCRIILTTVLLSVLSSSKY